MTTAFVKNGDRATFVNSSGSLVPAGELVVMGVIAGVAIVDIPDTLSGAVGISGVWKLTKLTTDAPTQGQLAYWDSTNKRLTVTSTANTLVGVFAEAAANGDTTANLLINVGL